MKDFSKHFSQIEKKIFDELDVILSHRSDRSLKDDSSYVTKADFLVQHIIEEYFNNNFDDFIFVSEEKINETIDLSQEKMIVVLDPIDGTENFTSGLPEWGLGLTIYIGNIHQASFIFIPQLKISLQTGQRIEYFQSRIDGLSSSLSKEGIASMPISKEYRIMGCSMYNMINVIKGSYNSFTNINGVNSWDILPGINLALEHNLEVKINEKTYKGEFLQPNQKYSISITR
ncbi:inositol monophosphatase [Gammaproteobacteria bacterium]|nr:inositol monophosphatase [Gammaproteobacteria bacterium]MDB2677769.1 inositol monophosphatase [Gammaproteobacteria bacterium]